MKNNIDISIIILNFNTKDLTGLCLKSILAVKTPSDRWEIVIVDNGSTDGSVKEIETFITSTKNLQDFVTLLPLDKNMGFAAGNNAGIKKSQGRYILLLNSDTEISENVFPSLLDLFDQDPTIAAGTVKLVLPDGNIDPACHRGFPTPWASFTYMVGLERLFPTSRLFGQYHQGYKNRDSIHEVDAMSGAFFFVRKSVVDQVGLLDEDFFMYGEDLDWAYRIKQAGWKILYIPMGGVLHKKKQSGRENKNVEVKKKTTRYFYETMKLFYRKHYMKKYPKILTTIIFFFIDLKLKILFF